MATTFVEYTGDGNATKQFTFPSIQESDIKVEVDGVVKTTSTHYNITSYTTTGGGNVVFTSGNIPASPALIRIFRDTDVDSAKATYTAGSSVKAADLNSNHKQLLFAAQEEQNQLIQTADIRDDAVTTAKIRDNAVTMDKLNSGALPTDITVASANIVDGTIVNADVNASAAIAGTKINPNFGTQVISTTGNISVGGTVDGRDVAADGTKLDGIETGATADQTAAEIRTLVESASDSNVFTDADHTKLNGIEAGATQDQTASEIRTLVESANNSNVFTDADHSKLNGIETAATADQTAAEIKTLLQSDKLTLSEINTTSTDSRYFTETELTNGALDGRYYTETESEARFLRQDSSETIASGVTWSSTDSKVATTAAIDLRIIELVDDVGGFVPIANETSFPTSNPDINNPATGGTIVSVKAASTNLAPSGTTVTIANGRGSGLAVVITGVTTTIPSGFGFLVETTSTDHTYAFHRLVPKATEVTTVATNITNIVAAGANVADINNFADLYQISNNAPTTRADSSSLQVGDLWFDSSSNKVLMIYDGSAGDGFSAATPNQSDLTNINIVAGHITFQEDLGLITNAVNTGSGNNSVNTVATDITNVNTVAGSISNVNAVAADATDIGAVAGKATEIGRLGTAAAVADLAILGTNAIVSDMDTLADISSNITTVAGISANVTSVAGNASNINSAVSNASNINSAVSNASNTNTVAGNTSNINTVAGISSNVTTVAGIQANVTAVANDATDIGAVAGKATEIGRLGTADAVADLAILGTTDVVADLNTLATSANVTALGNCSDDIANINTVSGSITNVNTTAGAIANVNTTASNIANVNTVAGISSNVTAVAGNNSNVTTVAGSISNVNTVAGSITDVNTFANRYRIASSAPTSSLDVGDLYFDTTQNELRVYSGSAWQGGVTAVGNLLLKTGGQMTGNITFSGSQTVDGRDLSADGTKLDGIESNATADQTASEIVALISGQTIAPNVITTTNLTLDFGSIA